MCNVPPDTGFCDELDAEPEGDDDVLHAARPAAANTAALSTAKRFGALVTGMFPRLEVELIRPPSDRPIRKAIGRWSDLSGQFAPAVPQSQCPSPDLRDP